MFLSAFSIRRPVAISMMILAVVVIGIVGYVRLGLDLMPEVDIPYVTVSVVYPGAGAREVETEVIEPLEDAVATVSGVKHLYAFAYEGYALVVAEFEVGKDPDVAAQDVRSRVETVRGQMPDDAEQPVVQKVDIRAQPIMDLAVSSRLSPVALRRLAEDRIKSAVERVPGVATASLVGGLEREIQVAVDRSRLEAHEISLAELVQTLSAQNLNVPAGDVTEEPERIVVRVPGQFTSVEAIREATLPTREGTIRVADVAQVLDTHKKIESIARLDGRPALALSVRKMPDANVVQTAQGVRKAIALLNRTLPYDTKIEVVVDDSQFAKEAVSDVINNLLLGGLFATIVVFLFLRSFRSTIVAFVVLPVSVISSFGLMYFAGFTLNIISMLGLAVAVGLLIDDAIVIIENIYRHIQRGESPKAAANDATGELALAVIATSSTLLAVFVPIAFMRGIIGKFFFEFGMTVAFAIIISTIVSLTLTPMVASRLLKPAVSGAGQGGGVLAAFGRFYDRLDASYRGVLDWALRHRIAVVLIGLGVFLVSLPMLRLLGSEFFPATEREQITVNLTLPPGTSLATTDQAARRVEAFVHGDPDVEQVLAQVGSTGASFIGGGGGTDTAAVKIRLVPKGKRRRSALALMDELRGKLSTLSGVAATVSQPAMGPGGEYRFQVDISGEDIDTLLEIASRARAAIADVPGLVDLDMSLRPGKPEVQVQVDRPKAAEVGITVAQAATTLRTAVDGTVAGQYREGGEEYDIRVQLREEDRRRVEQLEALRIGASNGMVPLGEVARLREATGPTEIERQEKQRVVSVQGNLAAGVALSDVTGPAEERLKALGMPQGYRYEFAGEAQTFAEASGDVGIALLLAVVFVFMVLAAQFESLLHPFTIGLSLPFALIGAILALLVTGTTLNMMSQIGIVMLMGIVTKNAILLVDYTNTLRARGLERREAILEAGPTRLRPVLMTTTTTVFALLPIALGLGAGSEMRAPMAICVIGGLLSSLLLTLVIVPVVYTYMDDLARRLSRGRADQPRN